MQYKIGQIVEGTITGIQPYGAFVSLDDKTCGLVHISEISDGFVKDVGNFVKVNDRIKVKVIDYDEKNNQVRLSLKAVNPNRFRKERKPLKYGSLPPMKLGFKSLEDKMKDWMEEAKERII
ncbi:MAG: S1 RNA-binding domain-containing protein [Erysipelotrichaceae bacterium]|nr:S1 RNA-binding domain-containing protein [Erysipelotrichaceae bacterium]